MTSVENLTTAEKWDYIYRFFGIKDVVLAITSPELQNMFLPLKIIFIFFSLFFLVAVIYFYINSSYIKYKYLSKEFSSLQPYGTHDVLKRWQTIMKRVEGNSQNEKEYKLALVEADDLLYEVLLQRGYKGEAFADLLKNARDKILPSYEDIVSAHILRNEVVHDPDHKVDLKATKIILGNYEKAIKNI